MNTIKSCGVGTFCSGSGGNRTQRYVVWSNSMEGLARPVGMLFLVGDLIFPNPIVFSLACSTGNYFLYYICGDTHHSNIESEDNGIKYIALNAMLFYTMKQALHIRLVQSSSAITILTRGLGCFRCQKRTPDDSSNTYH